MAGSTRPATAALREAIFNRPEVQAVVHGRVLDLYAGAGLLGVEALSRGAAWVDFVERSRVACGVIRHNIALVEADGRSGVHCCAVERCLARLAGPYALCFADPPYAMDAGAPLARLAGAGIVAKSGLLLWRRAREQPGRDRLGPLVRYDTRRYGDGVLDSFRMEREAP